MSVFIMIRTLIILISIITRIICTIDTNHPLHGVFANEWHTISFAEALNYFTPFEVCQLFLLNEIGNSINCSYFSTKFLVEEKCNLDSEGISRAQPKCGRNFGAALRHVSTKLWPKTRNVGDLLTEMTRMGDNTVIFLGDSMSGQQASDAFCNLQRLGYNCTRYCTGCAESSDFENLLTGKPNFYVHNPQSSSKAEHPYFQVLHVLFEHLRSADTYEIAEQSMQSILRGIIDSKFVKGRILLVVNIGLHLKTVDSYRQSLRWLFKYFSSPLFLSFFDEKKTKRPIIVFRETSAQHFRSATGEFPWYDTTFDWSFPAHLTNEIQGKFSYAQLTYLIISEFLQIFSITGNLSRIDGNSVEVGAVQRAESTLPTFAAQRNSNEKALLKAVDESYSCVPVRSHKQLESQNWRGALLQEVLDELRLRDSIPVIPFFNLTAARHDLHSRAQKDCSHYCQAPLLWLPVWDNLVRIYKERRNQ